MKKVMFGILPLAMILSLFLSMATASAAPPPPVDRFTSSFVLDNPCVSGDVLTFENVDVRYRDYGNGIVDIKLNAVGVDSQGNPVTWVYSYNNTDPVQLFLKDLKMGSDFQTMEIWNPSGVIKGCR